MLTFRIKDTNIDIDSILLWSIGIVTLCLHIFSDTQQDKYTIISGIFIVGAILHDKINSIKKE